MSGDMVNNLMVPLAGWTVPRPVFKRMENVIVPAVYPVSLTTLKSHLRVTHSSDDTYLTTLIATATAIAERFTNRRFVARWVRMWMDFIPGTGNEYTLYGAGTAQVPVRYASIGMFRWFELLYSPVAAVESIHFISDDGSDNVFDATQYIIDRVDENSPARVCLQRGTVWPVDLQVAHCININYILGYGIPIAVSGVGAPWVRLTIYALNDIVTINGNAYLCTQAGTSGSTGPSGSADGIQVSDGSCTWTYFGTAGVPPEIAHAVMVAAAALWSNRGDDADPEANVLGMPNVVNLLSQHRILQCGTM